MTQRGEPPITAEVDTEEPEAEGVEQLEATENPPELTEAERRGRVQLGANFFLDEFNCKDRHRTPCPREAVPALTRLVTDVLQPLRDRFGVCTVVSGFRTVGHNKEVGGKPNSRHLPQHYNHTPAADVRFRTGTVAQWAEAAEGLLRRGGGLGRYRTTIHVDQRDGRARW